MQSMKNIVTVTTGQENQISVLKFKKLFYVRLQNYKSTIAVPSKSNLCIAIFKLANFKFKEIKSLNHTIAFEQA